ncbi:Plasmodium exported protein, unknown function [Plasmodium malariae]|uniref:Uncharacterized protein n=1 Tax=Plasmodium malariae TaxID=5858 RepID=A0A1D3JJX6_PLAMA|nr:Plasmodium exported protein, unknown function [Plasmodium malariae]SBT86818.1 Plasmodium exported protein, unknown function [Plasmodium malariae]
MLENIKSFIFVKILAFPLLFWIFHYNNNVYTYCKSMNNNSILDEYSGLTINRLFSENSMDVILTGYTSDHKGDTTLIDEKRNIYKNDRDHKLRRKIKEILLKAEERNRLVKKKKSSLFNSIDSFIEKKIFKELDSINQMQYNMKIDKKIANRLIHKKIFSKFNPALVILLLGLILFSLHVLFMKLVIKEERGLGVLNNILDAVPPVLSAVLFFVSVLAVLGIDYTSKKIEKFNRKKRSKTNIYYNVVDTSAKRNI